jgi:hypothetical protein
MGLLDDAIREHLELKRRRGADPDEVERQEGEALGAPRRGEFARPDGAPDEAAAVEPPAGADEAPAPEPTAVDPEPVEPEPEPAAAEAPPWLEDERIEPAQPTAEFTPPDVEPEPEPSKPDEASAAGEEDVLEETPEFLQETPEHDRLWFEQKPPRDFDFDS